MITAKNYAAKAERGLHECAGVFKRIGLNVDATACSIIAHQISKSVHFALPDNGKVMDDSLHGMDGEELRLPYPSITVEYFADGEVAEGDILIQKRVILAYELDEKETIFICSVNFVEGKWQPQPMGFFLSRKWDGGMAHLVNKKNAHTFAGIAKVLLPQTFTRLKEKSAELGESDPFELMQEDCIADAWAVVELCEALSCSNVEAVSMEKTEDSVNAKRIRNGKLPLYETKVLTVKVSAADRGGTVRAGGHASPRQHLRRGHIRKLPTKKIWINSCVVGAAENGRIDKSYAVRK